MHARSLPTLIQQLAAPASLALPTAAGEPSPPPWRLSTPAALRSQSPSQTICRLSQHRRRPSAGWEGSDRAHGKEVPPSGRARRGTEPAAPRPPSPGDAPRGPAPAGSVEEGSRAPSRPPTPPRARPRRPGCPRAPAFPGEGRRPAPRGRGDPGNFAGEMHCHPAAR